MKLVRAILMGVLLWILIFVEWSIMIFAPVLKDLGKAQWLVHYIVLIPIAILCSWLYYKSKDKLNGFTLGAIFLIVGNILDLIITAPLFTGYVAYYSNTLLWLAFLELLVITGVYWIIAVKK